MHSPETPINHTRGGEKGRHRELKLTIGALLTRAGYDILFEQKGCDVVGIKHRRDGTIFILGVEAERSTRNVLRNIRRDLASGIHKVLVVAENKRLKRAIQRKISKASESFGNRVAVTTLGIGSTTKKSGKT